MKRKLIEKFLPMMAAAAIGVAASSAHATIVGTGSWSGGTFDLEYMVSNPDNDAWWSYEYWWTDLDPIDPPGISHLIIEVTPEADISSFRNFEVSVDGTNFFATTDVEVNLFASGGSNPGMPEDMWGIKFDDAQFFGDANVHIRFESTRNPVPGDYFAKGGRDGGAFNNGFTASDVDPTTLAGDTGMHILRPNGSPPPPDPGPGAVPEPLTGCLGLMGLGALGLGMRRRSV